MTLTVGLLAAAAVVLSTLGCERGREPAALAKTSLATGKNLWCTLPLIADEKKYFAAEGLDVTLNIQDAGRYCMDALLSKSVDFGAVVEANLAYVGFNGEQGLTVPASIVSSSCVIVARKSAGIERPEDLKGKRIAYSPGTGGEPFLFNFLSKHGIEADLRKLQPKALQAALVAREVDAASTWQPFVQNCARAMQGDAIEFHDPDVFTGYMMLAARKEWAARNREVVASMLRALRRSERFVGEHPQEAQEIMARVVGMEPEAVRTIWKDFHFRLALDPPTLARATNAVAENARKNDPAFAGKALPNYLVYFDPAFLGALR